MGKAKDCMYCVSEITNGFAAEDAGINERVWEKSLTLMLCGAGASAVRTGAIILELRVLIFMFEVAEKLGLEVGQEITDKSVLASLERHFSKGCKPIETAGLLRKEFPDMWGGGGGELNFAM